MIENGFAWFEPMDSSGFVAIAKLTDARWDIRAIGIASRVGKKGGSLTVLALSYSDNGNLVRDTIAHVGEECDAPLANGWRFERSIHASARVASACEILAGRL